uniref:Uncharacterized protein n=1 Tax=Odontella aurita TaxID=265563 RepID=A0A7S4HRQ2_9STRA|mmetsp:Transcript_14146/g.41505  ORF Transcript_14146/g.41505 Transcript_14146/m.41505 type:complete len:278 (+) Transcript_14146:136-969(+)
MPSRNRGGKGSRKTKGAKGGRRRSEYQRSSSKSVLSRLKENDPTLTIFRQNNKRIGRGKCGGENDPRLVEFFHALSSNTNVIKAELGGNFFGHTRIYSARGRLIQEQFAQSLAHHPSICEVYLWNNDISCWGAKQFAKALCENTTLKKLDLSMNNICDEGALALANAMKHNTTLEELNLYGNDISPVGCKAFVDVLRSKENVTAKKLNIGGQRRLLGFNKYESEINAVIASIHVERLIIHGELPNWDLYPAAFCRMASCCTLDSVYTLVRERADLIG